MEEAVKKDSYSKSPLYLSVLLTAFALPLSKALAIIGFALVILIGLIFWIKRQEPCNKPIKTLLILVAIWWGYKIIGLLWTDDFALANDQLTHGWYLFSIPAMAYYLKDKKLVGVLWAYALGSVSAILQSFMIASGVLKMKDPDKEGFFEPYFHIDYSILIGIGCLCLLWLRIKYCTTGIKARFLEISILLAFYNMFAMQNGRTGQMGLLVALISLPILIYIKKSPVKAVSLLVGVGVLSAIMFSSVPFFKDRWSSVYTEIDDAIENQNYFSSQGGRIGMWATAWVIVSRHPIAGTGTGDTEKVLAEVCNELYTPKVTIRLTKLAHFHNGYVQEAVQLGIPGLLIFLLMLLALWYVQGKAKEQAWLRAITILLLVSMMTEPFILKSRGRMAFSLLMGISLVLGKKTIEEGCNT